MALADLPSSSLLEDFIAATSYDLEQRTPLAALTPAERRVWDLLSQGFSRREMAQSLVVTEDTVKSHLSSIYRKVGVTNRRDAMRLAVEVASGTHLQTQHNHQ
jgi:DNA-binding CsgD family transcriptional regulator